MSPRLSRKDLAPVKPKSIILKNLGAVRPLLAVVTKQRGCVFGKEDSLTFLPGFQNVGQEVMLCTMRELVVAGSRKENLNHFKEGFLRAQH